MAPVLSAPLAATPAAAGPVVAPVDGMPELPPAAEAVGGEPVGGAPDETSADLPAEAPAPTGEQLPTDQVPAPAVATPQVDQRWAHMEPVGQQPTAYPGTNSTGPVPGLSAAVGSVPSPPAFQAPKGFGQMLAPSKVRTPEMMMRPRDLEMVARRADGHTMAGFELAGRRAYMSAQAEFLQALRMIAESLDIHHGTDRHSKALVAGMRALEESDEFMPTGRGLEGELDVRVLSQGHRSPVLTAEEAHGMAPLEARQRYYAYAQEQLAAAGAGETSASMALHGLGKLLTALAQAPDSPVLAPEPKAMVLQQAALLVDGRNALAANELGVLLARAGRYEQAREVLLHSARLLPQPTTWHNLAVVHFQLGEQDLGQLAQLESKAAEEHARQLAARRGVSINPHVQWLGPEEFAKTTATDMGAPGQPAVAPTSTAQQPAKSQGGKTR